MKLLLGRPSTNEGRLDKEIRVYDLLDSLGIEYYRIDHAPAMCCDDCVEIEKILDNVLCKNLFLCNRQETSFYMLMMPADKHFKTSEVSKQIGSSRLSFANSEYMEKFLDVTPGSVSIMGLMSTSIMPPPMAYTITARRIPAKGGITSGSTVSNISPAAEKNCAMN